MNVEERAVKRASRLRAAAAYSQARARSMTWAAKDDGDAALPSSTDYEVRSAGRFHRLAINEE